MVAPLSVTVRNNLSGRWLRLDSQVEQVSISTVVPGGFGTFVFQMAERVTRNLQSTLQSFYACDVLVTDQNGATLFEGLLTDIKLHSDTSDAYYECECTGWQLLLDNPYRNIAIEREIPWDDLGIQWAPGQIRPDLITTTIGQVSASDASVIGVRMDVLSGIALPGFVYGGAQVYFPVGTRIQRVRMDITTDTSHTAVFSVQANAINDAGALTGFAAVVGSGISTTASYDFAFGTGVRGVLFTMNNGGGATTSAACSVIISNIRMLSNRTLPSGAISTEENVYGHEIVSDIISQSQLLQDFSGLDVDISYAVPEFSYPTSDTARNALDAITAYYNKYWAVWESKRAVWKAWNPSATADWVVSRDSGAQVDIDPSIVNAGNVVRVQYTDAAGISQEVDVADTAQDNVYTLAGRSKTVIANLGVVSTAVAAARVGAVFFPDHSYEVVGGTITIDARKPCYSQTYGTMLPAYRIRAGESVRLRDGSSYKSMFDNASWNRQNLFRITATDLDWDNQVMKLTIDNSQASLDQITARIQTNLSAKYGT